MLAISSLYRAGTNLSALFTEAWSAERRCRNRRGGLSENIDNYVNGIKVPVRPDSIAWGIGHLIDDPVYMQRLGKAGRRKVMEKFQWGVVTGRMLDVYEKALSGGP